MTSSVMMQALMDLAVATVEPGMAEQKEGHHSAAEASPGAGEAAAGRVKEELDGAAASFLKTLATTPFLRATEGDAAMRDAALTYHREALKRNRKRLLAASGSQSSHRSGSGRDNRRPARFLQSGTEVASSDEFNGTIRVGLQYQATVTPFVTGSHGTTLTEREQVLCGAPLAKEDSVYVPLRAWTTGEIQAMEATLHAGDCPDFFTAGQAVWGDGATKAEVVDCYYHFWKQQPNVAHAKQPLWPPPMPRPTAKRARK